MIDWHRGRRRYAAWVVDLESPELRRQVEVLHDCFRGQLLTPYRRQLHLTLAVAGFVADERCYEDDYPACLRSRHLSDLDALDQKAFSLFIRGLDSFETALYLPVVEGHAAIMALRRVLLPDWGEGRTSPYVPHVTVGLYNQAVTLPDIRRQLATVPAVNLRVPIHAIQLVEYDAWELGGPLSVLTQIELGGLRNIL